MNNFLTRKIIENEEHWTSCKNQALNKLFVFYQMEFWLDCQLSLFRLSWVALHEVLWWFVCVTWVVMSLVFRAHKKRWSLFFRSSGNHVVTTVIVSGWYCGKSALPACDDLTSREICVAIYLFCRDLLWSPPTHPPPSPIPLHKKNGRMVSLWILLCKT